MKILHVVTLLALAVSAPVIAQPKDDVIGTTMYYLSIHHRIEKLKARAIKCTQETRIMQQKLQQHYATEIAAARCSSEILEPTGLSRSAAEHFANTTRNFCFLCQ